MVVCVLNHIPRDKRHRQQEPVPKRLSCSGKVVQLQPAVRTLVQQNSLWLLFVKITLTWVQMRAKRFLRVAL